MGVLHLQWSVYAPHRQPHRKSTLPTIFEIARACFLLPDHVEATRSFRLEAVAGWPTEPRGTRSKGWPRWPRERVRVSRLILVANAKIRRLILVRGSSEVTEIKVIFGIRLKKTWWESGQIGKFYRAAVRGCRSDQGASVIVSSVSSPEVTMAVPRPVRAG